MSTTASDPQSGTATDGRRGRLGPLPVWAWVLLAIVVVVVIAVLGFLWCTGGGANDPDPTPSPDPSTTSPTPSATSTASATATPATGSDVTQGTFASEMYGHLSDVLFSQNTAVLSEGGAFSNPIFVLAPHSGLSQNMTPDDAVAAMDVMFTPLDPNPWDLALSESTLDGYRAGPYGSYFPVGAIVARSSDGHVFSFIGHDATITTMFMAESEAVLH